MEKTINESSGLATFLFQDSSVSLIAGGLAGVVSRTTVSPFERVKILLQLQGSVSHAEYNTGVVGAIRQLYREEGVKGLFRGNGLNCIRIFPYSAVQFAIFEYIKKNVFHIDKSNGQLTNGQRLFAGSMGAAASLLVTHPLDLIRIRLSVQTANLQNLQASKAKDITKPPGFYPLFKQIYKNEGGIYGLYRGLIPTSFQVLPMVALNFAVYEQLKEFKEYSNAVMWGYKLMFGAVSGAVSQTITYPFDLLRKRFQIMNMGNNEMGFRYNGIWDGLKTIYRTEGVVGYYKGLTASLFKVIPSTAVSWLVYEVVWDFMKYRPTVE
ncbi:mitochondrial carrier protein Leu5p [Monosporozyma unispora]